MHACLTLLCVCVCLCACVRVCVCGPQVMGIAIFSPPLDSHGNSVKGVEFCKALLRHYPYGVFDSVTNTVNSDDTLTLDETLVEDLDDRDDAASSSVPGSVCCRVCVFRLCAHPAQAPHITPVFACAGSPYKNGAQSHFSSFTVSFVAQFSLPLRSFRCCSQTSRPLV
jgi:hypothetical protein